MTRNLVLCFPGLHLLLRQSKGRLAAGLHKGSLQKLSPTSWLVEPSQFGYRFSVLNVCTQPPRFSIKQCLKRPSPVPGWLQQWRRCRSDDPNGMLWTLACFCSSTGCVMVEYFSKVCSSSPFFFLWTHDAHDAERISYRCWTFSSFTSST